MSKYIYGWRRALPGLTYPEADVGGLEAVATVDPRAKMPPVFDQGQLGSCTANATAACFQYDSILDGKDCGELSRLWIYYFERSIEGTLQQGDCGAMGHDAFTVAKHGIPDETLWPYLIERFEAKPPDVEPRAYKLEKTVRSVPQSDQAIKKVFANNQTIAFGFTVKESFEDESWWHSARMPVPRSSERVLGGHEIVCVGELEEFPDFYIARNSWNLIYGLFHNFEEKNCVTPAEEKAGKGGYFLFPKALLLDKSTCSDLRTIVRPV